MVYAHEVNALFICYIIHLAIDMRHFFSVSLFSCLMLECRQTYVHKKQQQERRRRHVNKIHLKPKQKQKCFRFVVDRTMCEC